MFRLYILGFLGLVMGAQCASCSTTLTLDHKSRIVDQSKDRISGNLDIDPGSGQVSGQIQYSHLLTAEEIENGMSFYIPIDLEVGLVSGELVGDFEIIKDTSSYIGKFLKTISIELDGSTEPNTLINVSFEYNGTVDLRGFAQLDYPTEWVEVSANTLMLTPIPTDFPESRYTLRIKLPTDYQIVSPGQSLPGSEGETIVDSQDYIKGINFIFGKDLDIDHLNFRSTHTQLVSYKVSQSTKDRLGEMVGHTIDLYNHTFAVDQPRHLVTIALRPSDEWDASYAAGSNYFVTYDSQSDFYENEQFYYATYAHEMAHFWWKEADPLSNSNWLNEGFAEFSSLLALKSFYGDEAFNAKIKYHEAILDQVPEGVTLSNFERFGKYDQAMSYSAGALLVYDIYRELGERAFYQFLAKTLESQIGSTVDFIQFLKDSYSTDWVGRIIMKIE